MATKSTNSVLDNAVTEIAAEFRRCFFDHKKRAAQLANLKRHKDEGTFPPDLGIKICPTQLPATFSEADRDELLAAERRFWDTAKSECLSARIVVFERNVESSEQHLVHFESTEFLKKSILEKIPALEKDKEGLKGLLHSLAVNISAFKAAQVSASSAISRDEAFTKPAGASSSSDALTLQIQRLATTVDALSREISTLKNDRRLPIAAPAGARDPKNGGSPNRGRQSASRKVRNQERTRSATPARGNHSGQKKKLRQKN